MLRVGWLAPRASLAHDMSHSHPLPSPGHPALTRPLSPAVPLVQHRARGRLLRQSRDDQPPPLRGLDRIRCHAGPSHVRARGGRLGRGAGRRGGGHLREAGSGRRVSSARALRGHPRSSQAPLRPRALVPDGLQARRCCKHGRFGEQRTRWRLTTLACAGRNESCTARSC